MWVPTHVQLTVHRARNLKVKGKLGTNDCYVTIQLGKEKYHTSIKEKNVDPEWNEECDFTLPEQKQSFKLCLYHRNLIGMDEFLGQTEISLDQFNAYERPRKRWFPLFCKASSKKHDRSRGEIELTSVFMVQNMSGSSSNIEKQKKSFKTLSIKNLTNGFGNKLHFKWPSKSSLSGKSDLSSGNFSCQSISQKSLEGCRPSETISDPTNPASNVVSSSLASLVEEDSAVDSKGTSFESCINIASQCVTNRNEDNTPAPPASSKAVVDSLPSELQTNINWNKQNISSDKKSACNEKIADKIRKFKDATPLSVKSKTMNQTHQTALYELHEMEEYRKIAQRSLEQNEKSLVTNDLLEMFKTFSNEDLICLIAEQKQHLSRKDEYIRDLEDYIDNLLVKVIETQPKLLQKSCNDAGGPVQETSPLDSIMQYSTVPRNYNQAVPSGRPRGTSHFSKKKYVQSIWKRGSVAVSPLKKFQAFIK